MNLGTKTFLPLEDKKFLDALLPPLGEEKVERTVQALGGGEGLLDVEEEGFVVFTKAYPYDDEVFQIQEALGVDGETIVYIVAPSLLPKILPRLKDPPAEPPPTTKKVEEAEEVRLDATGFALAKSFPKHLAERPKAIPRPQPRRERPPPHGESPQLAGDRRCEALPQAGCRADKSARARWRTSPSRREGKEANEEALSEEEGPARLFLYIEEGMLTLRIDGLLKAARGITTLEEVLARTVE